MAESKEIVEELLFNDRFLCDAYKNSVEYREYLDTVNKQLKQNTWKKAKHQKQ